MEQNFDNPEVVQPSDKGIVLERPGRMPAEIDMSSVEAIERQAQRVEKYMEVQVRIRRACIRITNTNDWVDQDGKPYLQWTGAAKIAGAFGVSYDAPKYLDPKPESDEAGSYINYEVQTLVRYSGRSIPEMGTASTRDSFFGVRTKKDEKGNVMKDEKGAPIKYFLPISEMDINDIKKKALTNLLNRGLKSLLGLSFTWEEIEKESGGEITRLKCASVKHTQGADGGKTTSAATIPVRQKIWKQILEMADGEEAVARAKLAELTTFKGDKGMVPGKTDISLVSDAMLRHLEPNTQKAYDVFMKGINAANPEAKA
jgi:hypothetical protein